MSSLSFWLALTALREATRGVVLIGMAAALCCSIDDIVSARRRGDHE